MCIRTLLAPSNIILNVQTYWTREAAARLGQLRRALSFRPRSKLMQGAAAFIAPLHLKLVFQNMENENLEPRED